MSITGFDKETKPLNAFEKELLPGMIKGLRTKWGKENAISARQIIQAYRAQDIKISGARVRKMINYIRIKRLVTKLISSNRGYYRATKKKEILLYQRSLQERIDAIQAVADSYKTEIESWEQIPK